MVSSFVPIDNAAVRITIEIIEAMMKIHQYSMLCASIISQEAALEAIQYGEPDMMEMRDQYKLRRNFIVDAFNRMGRVQRSEPSSRWAWGGSLESQMPQVRNQAPGRRGSDA